MISFFKSILLRVTKTCCCFQSFFQSSPPMLCRSCSIVSFLSNAFHRTARLRLLSTATTTYESNNKINCSISDIGDISPKQNNNNINYITRGREFEEKCACELAVAGLQNVRVQGQTGDGGIDIVGSIKEHNVIAQCKYVKTPVGVSVLREIEGALHRQPKDTIGIVCSASGFSKGAKEFVITSTFPLILFSVPDNGVCKIRNNPAMRRMRVKLKPPRQGKLVIKAVNNRRSE
eukprot:m.163185 g.163185  ORF g.163185 m.163185 type:complete len:233 (+) comp13413_c1_seq1:3897-4595(+)